MKPRLTRIKTSEHRSEDEHLGQSHIDGNHRYLRRQQWLKLYHNTTSSHPTPIPTHVTSERCQATLLILPLDDPQIH
jgi:hypothetical protein